MKNYCDIKDPKDITTKEFVEQTITPVGAKIDKHIKDEANPHKVTAEQVDTYDKKQINNGLFEEVPVTMMGTAVSTDMVSTVEHEVECRVESKNIMQITQPVNGISMDSSQIITIAAPGSDYGIVHNFKKIIPTGTKITITIYCISGEIKENATCAIGTYKSKQEPKTWTNSVRFPTGNIAGEIVTNTVITNTDTDSIYIFPYIRPVITDVKFKCQIEIGDKTEWTPHVPDLTAVTVSRYGKNLWSFGNILDIYDFEVRELESKLTEPFTVSIENITSVDDKSEDWKIQFLYESGKAAGYISANGAIASPQIIPASTKNPVTKIAMRNMTPRTEYKVQIEIGKHATSFEKYISPQTFSVDSSSAVSGMTSISPNMTILTDNPNVIVEATYNADVSKYTAKQPLTPEEMLKAEKLKFSKVDDKVIEATKKYSIPRTEGTDGQFALSDGKGGIRFETFINRAEVGL